MVRKAIDREEGSTRRRTTRKSKEETCHRRGKSSRGTELESQDEEKSGMVEESSVCVCV